METVEETNEKVCDTFQDKFTIDTDNILDIINMYKERHEASCTDTKEQLAGQLEHRADQLTQLADTVTQLLAGQGEKLTQLTELSAGARSAEREWCEGVKGEVKKRSEGGEERAKVFLEEVNEVMDGGGGGEAEGAGGGDGRRVGQGHQQRHGLACRHSREGETLSLRGRATLNVTFCLVRC